MHMLHRSKKSALCWRYRSLINLLPRFCKARRGSQHTLDGRERLAPGLDI